MGFAVLRGKIPLKLTSRLSFLFLIFGMTLGFSWFPTETSEAGIQPGLINSCIDCHQSLPDKRLSHPVQLWSESVHAEVGNTCEGCHGGDPKETSIKAMSGENGFKGVPKEEETASFCGKCHQEISKNYMDSPHGMLGQPTCKYCHGSHAIERIGDQIISEDKCTMCHEYESPAKLKEVLQVLHRQFQEAKNKVKLINGFPTEPLEKDLKENRKNLRQVQRTVHKFDLSLIQIKAEDAKTKITQTTLEIDRLIELTQNRKKWGLLIVLVFIGLTVLTYFYNKQNQEMD